MSSSDACNSGEQHILSYARSDDKEWTAIAYYVSEEEAWYHIAILSTAKIAYQFAPSKSYYCRPDGTRTQIQLSVLKPDWKRAFYLTALTVEEGVELEPEKSMTGDESLIFIRADRPELKLKPFLRFENAQQLLDAAAVLWAARISSVTPLLYPRESLQSVVREGRSDRFVLRVLEGYADDARHVFLDDAVPQDDDEPRCPRCRSWRVDKIRTTAIGALRDGKHLTEEQWYRCSQCDYLGYQSRFFRKPILNDEISFAEPSQDRASDLEQP